MVSLKPMQNLCFYDFVSLQLFNNTCLLNLFPNYLDWSYCKWVEGGGGGGGGGIGEPEPPTSLQIQDFSYGDVHHLRGGEGGWYMHPAPPPRSAPALPVPFTAGSPP